MNIAIIVKGETGTGRDLIAAEFGKPAIIVNGFTKPENLKTFIMGGAEIFIAEQGCDVEGLTCDLRSFGFAIVSVIETKKVFL